MPSGGSSPRPSHEHVAAAPIDLEALGDVPLVAAQRRHEAELEGDRDAGGEMVEQHADASDDLRVADREAHPPAGHAVDLRGRPQLDGHLAGPVDLEHAARAAPVEGQEGVGEVVEQPAAALVRPRDGSLERPRRLARRARVGGVVEDHERWALVAQRVEVGLPAGGGVERQRHPARTRQGDGGQVVRVAGVGQGDRLARVRAGQHGEHDRGLGPRHHGDLALGIELHAVIGAVVRRDRLAQLGAALEGRVAVHAAGGRELGLQRLERDRRAAAGRGCRGRGRSAAGRAARALRPRRGRCA